MRHLFLVVASVLLLSSITYGQSANPTPSPYIKQGSIGISKPTPPNLDHQQPFPTKKIAQWPGERFIFLPMQKLFQGFGYQSFKVESGRRLLYVDYVGKIIKAIRITPMGPKNSYYVDFEVESTGEMLKASAFSETVEGIASISDIDNARKAFQGKTFQTTQSLCTYDADTDEVKSKGGVQLVTVKVFDVVAGWDTHAPVRFILSYNGQEPDGFVDVHVSNTNIPAILQKLHNFYNAFQVRAADDPRTKRP